MTVPQYYPVGETPILLANPQYTLLWQKGDHEFAPFYAIGPHYQALPDTGFQHDQSIDDESLFQSRLHMARIC